MQENHNHDATVFSKAVRAGKRTYFFDVRRGRDNDLFIKMTESKRLPDSNQYLKHSILLYKEDFEKFFDAFKESLDYIQANAPRDSRD